MARKSKNTTEVVLQLDKRFNIPFRLIFTLILIFAGAMVLTLLFAKITELEHQINVTEAAISNQRDDNTALRSEITQKYTLDEVKQLAEDRLGMQKPDSSQIISIYVPKESFSELSLDSVEEETETFWQSVLSFIKDLFRSEDQ